MIVWKYSQAVETEEEKHNGKDKNRANSSISYIDIVMSHTLVTQGKTTIGH